MRQAKPRIFAGDKHSEGKLGSLFERSMRGTLQKVYSRAPSKQ
jgi:hypothetical protein